MIPDRRGLLIASLPRNDPALARAARDAGADLIKCHVNVSHRAAGTRFGSLAEEEGRLREILSLGLPVGLVPGEEAMVGRDEVARLHEMGFAFLDAYLDALPLYLYESGIEVVPAYRAGTPIRRLAALAHLPGSWLEAPVVAPDGYGREPVADDLLRLAEVGRASGRRLIVPTQRRMAPDHLPRYFALPEVWAIMIGAVVTGSSAESLAGATAAFRAALDRLFA